MLGPAGGEKKPFTTGFSVSYSPLLRRTKTITTHHMASQTKPINQGSNNCCSNKSKKNTTTNPHGQHLYTCLFWSEVYTWQIDKRSNGLKHFGMPWQWYLARSSPNGCQWEGLKFDLDLSCPIPSISKVYWPTCDVMVHGRCIGNYTNTFYPPKLDPKVDK